VTVKQFGRAIVVEFADIKIEATTASQDSILRVAFNVERDKLPWPNNAELAVYNLSATTRAKLTAAGPVSAKISAGYVGDVNQIFFGVLDIVEHIKDGTEWITRMSASDAGEKIKQCRVSTSFSKEQTYLTVVRSILKTIGLGEGNLGSIASAPELARKLAHGGGLHGNAVEELAYFLRSCGHEFSIQDGKVQFLKIGSGAAGLEAPLISAESGMLGSPRLVREKCTDLTRPKTKKTTQNTVETFFGEKVDMITTVEGECLLNARMVPGVSFEIKSESVNGTYLCCASKHSGDTRANDWATSFKGMPLADI
jgi:hypothetical protein